MSTYDSYFEPYTGARSTGELVGRVREVQQVLPLALQARHSQLIHIIGQGGTGKTRFVSHLLNLLSQEGGLRVAQELIDLYHAETNTVEGLIGEMVRVLDAKEEAFRGYRAARREMEEARVTRPDETQAITQLRDSMLAAFRQDLDSLSKERRVVIALDTTEKLDLQKDPVTERLGLSASQTDTVEWLVENINGLRNVVLLLAGRPGNGWLSSELRRTVAPSRYHAIELQGLNEEEALIYVEAVLQAMSASSNKDDLRAALRITKLPKTVRQTIFYSLRDEGTLPTVRPIMLALALDYLIFVPEPDELLPQFKQSLENARRLTSTECAENRDRLGSAIINILAGRLEPADELVRILGWLRKGADKQLLARISGLDDKKFDAGWENIQNLSFVKRRPRDNRLFLHDEMYAIVQKHALDRIADKERETVFTRLREYYNQEIQQTRIQIDESYRPLAGTPQERLSDPNQLIQLQKEVRTLLVEDIYYRLRFHAERGFQSYFRYSEDAVPAFDEELGTLLRAEMRAFVEEFGLEEKTDGFDGLRYADVAADAAVRWVKWNHHAGHYPEAVRLAQLLQGELHAELIEPGGVLATAELNSWSGLLLAESGDYVEGELLLQKAIDSLQPKQTTQRWLAILASAYNNLGYLYSNQGRNHRAVDVFEQALPLWRALKMESQHATTLNNLAFALAELGIFERGHQFVRDSLRLREKLGPQQPVGYTLSTMAEISIRAFASELAVEQAANALEIFTRLKFPRGRGLTLRALAEAKRRISVSPTNRQLKRTVELLEEAETHALEAVRIFRDEIAEPVREIWALLELGCVYRDWFRWRLQEMPELLSPREIQGERPIMSTEALFQASIHAFQTAEALTEEHKISSHHLDVLIGWARLLYDRYFNAQSGEFDPTVQQDIDKLFTKIITLFTEKYGERSDTIVQRINELPRDDYLIRLGDWETLLAEMALRRFQNKSGDSLHEAAQHFTLAFECYQRYTEHVFRQSRRSRNRLYEALKAFGPTTMLQFYESAEVAARQYDLHSSELLKFLVEQFGPKETHLVLDL